MGLQGLLRSGDLVQQNRADGRVGVNEPSPLTIGRTTICRIRRYIDHSRDWLSNSYFTVKVTNIWLIHTPDPSGAVGDRPQSAAHRQRASNPNILGIRPTGGAIRAVPGHESRLPFWGTCDGGTMQRSRAFAEVSPSQDDEAEYILRGTSHPASIGVAYPMNKNSQDEELLVIAILPKYIGERYALLVRSLGYRTLDDLAGVRESRLSVLGGFGESRMADIRQALADHGKAFYDGPKVDLTGQIRATADRLAERFDRRPGASRSHPRIAQAAESPNGSPPGSAHGGGRRARRAAAH